MTVRETMERLRYAALKANKPMTHWLMSHDTYDRFRYEVSAMTFTAAADSTEQPKYADLPIYFIRSMAPSCCVTANRQTRPENRNCVVGSQQFNVHIRNRCDHSSRS